MKQDNNSSKTASTSNVSEKELLRKTFLHELKQDYIYKAMCNPAYKDLMAQKKDVLAHNPLTNEDIRILARQTKAGYREGRKPIDQKKKDNAVALILSNHSYSEASQITGLSKSTIIRAMRAYRAK